MTSSATTYRAYGCGFTDDASPYVLVGATELDTTVAFWAFHTGTGRATAIHSESLASATSFAAVGNGSVLVAAYFSTGAPLVHLLHGIDFCAGSIIGDPVVIGVLPNVDDTRTSYGATGLVYSSVNDVAYVTVHQRRALFRLPAAVYSGLPLAELSRRAFEVIDLASLALQIHWPTLVASSSTLGDTLWIGTAGKPYVNVGCLKHSGERACTVALVEFDGGRGVDALQVFPGKPDPVSGMPRYVAFNRGEGQGTTTLLDSTGRVLHNERTVPDAMGVCVDGTGRIVAASHFPSRIDLGVSSDKVVVASLPASARAACSPPPPGSCSTRGDATLGDEGGHEDSSWDLGHDPRGCPRADVHVNVEAPTALAYIVIGMTLADDGADVLFVGGRTTTFDVLNATSGRHIATIDRGRVTSAFALVGDGSMFVAAEEGPDNAKVFRIGGVRWCSPDTGMIGKDVHVADLPADATGQYGVAGMGYDPFEDVLYAGHISGGAIYAIGRATTSKPAPAVKLLECRHAYGVTVYPGREVLVGCRADGEVQSFAPLTAAQLEQLSSTGGTVSATVVARSASPIRGFRSKSGAVVVCQYEGPLVATASSTTTETLPIPGAKKSKAVGCDVDREGTVISVAHSGATEVQKYGVGAVPPPGRTCVPDGNLERCNSETANSCELVRGTPCRRAVRAATLTASAQIRGATTATQSKDTASLPRAATTTNALSTKTALTRGALHASPTAGAPPVEPSTSTPTVSLSSSVAPARAAVASATASTSLEPPPADDGSTALNVQPTPEPVPPATVVVAVVAAGVIAAPASAARVPAFGASLRGVAQCGVWDGGAPSRVEHPLQFSVGGDETNDADVADLALLAGTALGSTAIIGLALVGLVALLLGLRGRPAAQHLARQAWHEPRGLASLAFAVVLAYFGPGVAALAAEVLAASAATATAAAAAGLAAVAVSATTVLVGGATGPLRARVPRLMHPLLRALEEPVRADDRNGAETGDGPRAPANRRIVFSEELLFGITQGCLGGAALHAAPRTCWRFGAALAALGLVHLGYIAVFARPYASRVDAAFSAFNGALVAGLGVAGVAGAAGPVPLADAAYGIAVAQTALYFAQPVVALVVVLKQRAAGSSNGDSAPEKIAATADADAPLLSVPNSDAPSHAAAPSPPTATGSATSAAVNPVVNPLDHGQ